MGKIAVIYWSQTGNTEMMANAIAEGIASAGVACDLKQVSELSAADAAGYGKLALGCPAMGAEVLEEAEFEPFFTELEGRLGGHKVALFGSYGWGDGQWMRDWCERADHAGADVYLNEGLMVNETPDEAGLSKCRALGEAFAAY
ncbi:flavodoxin [Butyricicoccus faecihominis]|uniref:flavodoxin n=1 Tax=Butyricicoccus faecihominis TaxID=1712515 RepID=UPI00247964B9|nr:flavodoxin [Butyricicoccus faecihominis]MCQ5130379.1 flavodoxin [Butyricicoccus faecihominis]